MADVADYVLLERPQVWPELGFFEKRNAEAFRRRKTPYRDGNHARHVGAGLAHRDAGFQAGQGAITEIAELGFAAVPFEGKKNGGLALVKEMKILRKDADNFARLSIERDGAANDVRGAAEFLAPIAVREESGFGRARRIIFARKQSAQRGLCSEKGQRSIGHVD